MQVRTTMKYYHTTPRMAKIKMLVRKPNTGKDAEKPDHSNIAGGNVQWYNHFGKKSLTMS